MANITLDQLRAKYPPEDRDEYDRAYAAATLAGQLAELVYTLRTRAGLTQTELARRMGTTQSSIARIESGGSLPTLNMLARLAHATGTPLRLAAPESPTSTSAEPPDQIPLPGYGPA
jgi:transcriptional regulator with XRE-family HTH domain